MSTDNHDAEGAGAPRQRTLKESLARYMDPEAFREPVPDAVKFTSKESGRVAHDKLKARRVVSMKRAEAAIRFFSKPENREALDHRKQALDASHD